MIVFRKRLPDMFYREHFHVIPLGDIHYGVENCDVDKLKETVDWIASKKNVWVLGMGDYIEAINYTDPRFDPANIRKGHNLDDLIKDQTDDIIKILKPIKHRIIGLLEGNHEETVRLKYHQSVVDKMAMDLGVPNLSYSCFIGLCVERKNGRTHRMITIWAHHGMSSGRALGGTINTLVTKSHEFEADVYLMGHCHKKLVYSSPILSMSTAVKNNELQEKKKLFGITGTFYRTYRTGTKSYAEKAGYSPTETGVINIRVQPFRFKKVNGKNYHLQPHLHISA